MITFECVGFLFYMNCKMPEPPHTNTVVCPPIIQIEPDLQRRAATELKGLPPGAALRSFIARSIEQRDVLRRCRKVKRR